MGVPTAPKLQGRLLKKIRRKSVMSLYSRVTLSKPFLERTRPMVGDKKVTRVIQHDFSL
jgi:hypothetical protein